MAHEAYCASCHSRPQAAFLSYPVSRLLKPTAAMMDSLRIDIWLWTLHFLASCLALACLPFSKFFHLLATPLNLLARTAGPVSTGPPALRPHPTRFRVGCLHPLRGLHRALFRGAHLPGHTEYHHPAFRKIQG